MNRRTFAVRLVAVLGAAALAACSTDDGARTVPATSDPVPPSATVAPSTTGASSATVAPNPVGIPPAALVTPPAGKAPARTFAVGTRKLSLSRGKGRPLPTTVWYPAVGTAGREPAGGLTPATGPFPVVLFSHGLTAQPSDYSAMLTRWAQAGFVVAAPAYPFTSTGVPKFSPLDVINQPADASAVLTGVLALNGKAGDPLQGKIDTDRVAATGHSAGGITTVGLFTGSRDERLDAGIVLAGRRVLTAPFSGTPAPMLFVHGKRDRTVAYADGLAAFKAVPWPRAMLSIAEGGHLVNGGDYEAVAGTTVEFLRWSLYGDAAAKARIPGQAARDKVAKLTNEL
jgi:dienelactone hydrolase